MEFLETVSNGIQTVIYWIQTAWNSMTDEMRPSIDSRAVIVIILIIIFRVLKVKKK